MSRRGFTLIEVVIALAVVSLALLALVRTTALGTEALAHERELTLASLVAANVLAEARLERTYPSIGERGGRATMGPREFEWKLVVQGTGDPAVRRLDVRVYAADAGGAAPLASMSGFAGQR